MKQQTQLRSAWLTMLLLVTAFFARGQTVIPISGPADVCKNNTETYYVSPTSGLTYSWVMSSAIGNFSSAYGASTSIMWFTTGSTTLTVQGKNSSGTVIQQGTLTVTSHALPQPLITTDYRVGCENLPNTPKQQGDEPPQADDGPLFDGDGCVKVCEGSWVTYSAHGFAGSSYAWSVSGGTIISTTATTCVVQWGTPGQGSITVQETTSAGCEGIRTVCIEIIGKPHAVFGAQPDLTLNNINICRNQTVYFVDASYTTSTSPIVNWFWDFGDNTIYSTSAATNPSHTYTVSGTYSVRLVVKNACNCTDTAWMTINVSVDSTLAIICPGVVCENDPQPSHYTLSDPGVSCGSYNWSVTGGTIVNNSGTSIDVLWDQVGPDGFGYVMFDASSCNVPCPGITTIKIPIIQQKGTITGPLVVCPNSINIYRLPAWPGTIFNWTVSYGTGAFVANTDQPNEIALNAVNPGMVHIHCDYTNTLLGCGGFADYDVEVQPAVHFSGPDKACIGAGTYILDNSYSGYWVLTQPNNITQTGYGNIFTASFPSAGVYSLSVSGNFCSQPPLAITVLPTPLAADSLLGPDTVCAGVPYTFTAKNSQPGTIFKWAVSGGGIQGATTGNNVTVIFSGSGPYMVSVYRMLVQDPHCTSAALSKQVYAPHVDVNVTGVTIPCPSSYASYAANYAAGETYDWFIIPNTAGTISSGNGTANATVLWNNYSGAAKVVVTVRKCDIKYSDTLDVNVNPIPALSLSVPSTICRDVPAPVSIIVSGSVGLTSGNISWNFGDGATASTVITGPGSLSTTHPYTTVTNSNLTYNVVVTITNVNGCAGSTIILNGTIIVWPAPVAFITPPNTVSVCSLSTQTLYADLQSGAGVTSGIAWYQGGTQIYPCGFPGPAICSTASVASFGFGNYYVIATGTNGCTNQSNTVSFIQNCGGGGTGGCQPSPPVTVSFDPPAENCGTVTLTGHFSSTSFYPFSLPHFNVPSTFTPQFVGSPYISPMTGTYTASAAGKYQVEFQVTYPDANNQPCIQTYGAEVIVPIVPGILYGSACNSTNNGYVVTLYDHTNYYPLTTITNYEYFDGGVSVGSGPTLSQLALTTLAPGSTHYFTEVVTYTYNGVSNSCTTSVMPVVVPSLPIAAFTFAPSSPDPCTGLPISFTNGSSFATAYNWSFDDGSSNLQTSPSKAYAVPTTITPYNVVLTATNNWGCYNQITHSVSIHANDLSGTLDATTNTICDGGTATLSYNTQGGGSPNNYAWYNDLTNFLNENTGSIGISQTGSYWVHATDVHGCFINTNTQPISVISVPDPIITGDSLQCIGDDFTLYGYAGDASAIAYSWTRNGSTIGGNQDHLDESGLAVGTYVYQLTVTVTDPISGIICSKVSDPFTVIVNGLPASPTISYAMNNCADYELILTATGPSAGSYAWSNGSFGNPVTANVGGPYKVWFTDGATGCVSSGEVDIPKDPRGYLWVFPEGCYTLCLPSGGLSIHGPIIPFYYWEWDRNTSMVNNGSGTVTPLQVTLGGNYSLTLDNGLCSATSGTMDITNKCEDGKVTCADINAQYVSLTYDTLCNMFVHFLLTNTGSGAAPYTIIPNNGGTMSPATGTLLPGSVAIQSQWTPPPSFSGGSAAFTIVFTLPNGEVCRFVFKASFKNCPYKPQQKFVGPDGSQAGIATGGAMLQLYPNPAGNVANISYTFNAVAGKDRRVDVYDMTGRKLTSIDVSAQQGTQQLVLDSWASGVYTVVLKENGAVVATSRLTIAK